MTEKKKSRFGEWLGRTFRPLGLFLERAGLFADFVFSSVLPRRKITRRLRGVCAENHKSDMTNDSRGYVNDQGVSGALGKLRFGDYSLNDNGCGIISVYNSLTSVGERASMADIADVFSRERINVNGLKKRGKYGANPFSLRRGIKAFGFECKKVPLDELSQDGLYIIGYFNPGETFFATAHFITVKTADDVSTAYNYSRDNRAVTVDTENFRRGFIRGYRLTKTTKSTPV